MQGFGLRFQFLRKVLSGLMACVFAMGSVVPSYAQSVALGAQGAVLPPPGGRIEFSAAFTPAVLKGVRVYADNPFIFDFILDKGDFEAGGRSNDLNEESTRLVKYFLTALTVPEKDLWVNLSPYEKDRIIPDAFGQTEMGRDFLAQDYILKQITASAIYPEETLGQKFWAEVYRQVQEKYGTVDISVDTFNKVWIVPEKAVVYEKTSSTPGVGAVAYIVESRLKVMLESDYLAQEKDRPVSRPQRQQPATQELAKQIIREMIVPMLEKEVNEGKNFALLRQVYQSLILAAWYKRKIKESFLSKIYIDRNKVQGVHISDPKEAEKIWAQYVEAFKKGAYNYIREEADPVTGDIIPRKYFSGGFEMAMTADRLQTTDQYQPAMLDSIKGGLVKFRAVLNKFGRGSAGKQASVRSETPAEIAAREALEKEKEEAERRAVHHQKAVDLFGADVVNQYEDVLSQADKRALQGLRDFKDVVGEEWFQAAEHRKKVFSIPPYQWDSLGDAAKDLGSKDLILFIDVLLEAPSQYFVHKAVPLLKVLCNTPDEARELLKTLNTRHDFVWILASMAKEVGAEFVQYWPGLWRLCGYSDESRAVGVHNYIEALKQLRRELTPEVFQKRWGTFLRVGELSVQYSIWFDNAVGAFQKFMNLPDNPATSENYHTKEYFLQALTWTETDFAKIPEDQRAYMTERWDLFLPLAFAGEANSVPEGLNILKTGMGEERFWAYVSKLVARGDGAAQFLQYFARRLQYSKDYRAIVESLGWNELAGVIEGIEDDVSVDVFTALPEAIFLMKDRDPKKVIEALVAMSSKMGSNLMFLVSEILETPQLLSKWDDIVEAISGMPDVLSAEEKQNVAAALQRNVKLMVDRAPQDVVRDFVGMSARLGDSSSVIIKSVLEDEGLLSQWDSIVAAVRGIPENISPDERKRIVRALGGALGLMTGNTPQDVVNGLVRMSSVAGDYLGAIVAEILKKPVLSARWNAIVTAIEASGSIQGISQETLGHVVASFSGAVILMEHNSPQEVIQGLARMSVIVGSQLQYIISKISQMPTVGVRWGEIVAAVEGIGEGDRKNVVLALPQAVQFMDRHAPDMIIRALARSGVNSSYFVSILAVLQDHADGKNAPDAVASELEAKGLDVPGDIVILSDRLKPYWPSEGLDTENFVRMIRAMINSPKEISQRYSGNFLELAERGLKGQMIRVGDKVMGARDFVEMVLSDRQFRIPGELENFIRFTFHSQYEERFFTGPNYKIDSGAAEDWSREAVEEMDIGTMVKKSAGRWLFHGVHKDIDGGDVLPFAILRAGYLIAREALSSGNEQNVLEQAIKKGSVNPLGRTAWLHFGSGSMVVDESVAVAYPDAFVLNNFACMGDPLLTTDFPVRGFSRNLEHESHRVPVRAGIILIPKEKQKAYEDYFIEMEKISGWVRPNKVFFYDGNKPSEGWEQLRQMYAMPEPGPLVLSEKPHIVDEIANPWGGSAVRAFSISKKHFNGIHDYEALPLASRFRTGRENPRVPGEILSAIKDVSDALADTAKSVLDEEKIVLFDRRNHPVQDTGSTARGTYNEDDRGNPKDYDLMVYTEALPSKEKVDRFAQKMKEKLGVPGGVVARALGSDVPFTIRAVTRPDAFEGRMLTTIEVLKQGEENFKLFSIDINFYADRLGNDGPVYREMFEKQINHLLPKDFQGDRGTAELKVLATIRTLKKMMEDQNVYKRQAGGLRGVGVEQLVLQAYGRKDGVFPEPVHSMEELERYYSVEAVLKWIENIGFTEQDVYRDLQYAANALDLKDPGNTEHNLANGMTEGSWRHILRMAVESGNRLREIRKGQESPEMRGVQSEEFVAPVEQDLSFETGGNKEGLATIEAAMEASQGSQRSFGQVIRPVDERDRVFAVAYQQTFSGEQESLVDSAVNDLLGDVEKGEGEVRAARKVVREIMELYSSVVKQVPAVGDAFIPAIFSEVSDLVKNFGEETNFSLVFSGLGKIRMKWAEANGIISNMLKQAPGEAVRIYDEVPALKSQFWSKVNSNPVVRENFEAIISQWRKNNGIEGLAEGDSLRDMVVYHSLNGPIQTNGIVGAMGRLQKFFRYPGLREVSCFVNGQRRGLVLKIKAKVRRSFSVDVGASLNPYTGLLGSNGDIASESEYSPLDTGFKPHESGLHNESDEHFARFDLNQDLEAVYIGDPKTSDVVKEMLASYGLEKIPVIVLGADEKLPSVVDSVEPAMAKDGAVRGDAEKDMKKGGIDLTGSKVDRALEMRDDGGAGMKFDITPAMIEEFNSSTGLTPVIINMQPANDLPRFLGVKVEDPALNAA